MAPVNHQDAENPAVNDLLNLAQALKDEKEGLHVRITANRDVLRGYVRMGAVSAEQAKAVEAFYPTPKPREKSEGKGKPAANKG